MSGLGEAASRIGEKVVEILDIFDLSFFISGAVAVGAILVGVDGGDSHPITGDENGTLLFGLVLGSYVLGLAAFSIGRFVRSPLTKLREADALAHAMRDQGLEAEDGGLSRPIVEFFGTESIEGGDRWPLYTRMWVHVRSYPSLAESFALLRRYWILSASYDGIATAALVWLWPIWTKAPQEARLGLTALVVAISLFCWHRAFEYKRYQITELVATVAHWITLVGKPVLDKASAGPSAPSPSNQTQEASETTAAEQPQA
ncbi:MAG: hypothetical protein K0V04_15795 [Deltaproteobacteria bacterium]|nr:hypothetical protein [Deltaproteobacteria bacterium]